MVDRLPGTVNGQMPVPRQKYRDRHGGGDGKLADSYWNHCRRQASEGHQQKYERCRNREVFGVLHIVCAGFPNVEIEWRRARHFELHRRISALQLILKSFGALTKLRHKRFHRAGHGREAHHNKSSSALAEENRIAKIEMGNHSGNIGLLSQSIDNGCQGLLAGL